MKKILTFLSVLAISPGLGTGAVIYEGFDSYSPSVAVPSLNSGSGWSGAWAGNNNVTVQTVQLDDPNGQIDGGTQSMLLGGVNDNALLSRSFGALTGTVYMSMLIRAGNYSNDFTTFQLTDGATGDNTQALSIGIRNTASNNFMARSGASSAGSQTVNSTTTLSASTNYFLVGVFSQGLDGQYDTVDLYVNPTDATLITETAAATASSTMPNITQISMFTVRTAVYEGDESLYVDELRISNNLAEVFNIPEPSSLMLTSIGLALLLSRRRR